MKKQFKLVIVLGILVVIISAYFNNKNDKVVNKKNQDLIENSSSNMKNIVEDEENDLSKLNGQENPDNYKFEIFLNNFFEALKLSVLENDISSVYDFIEQGSKFEDDLTTYINELYTQKKEYNTEYIIINKVEELDSKFIVNTQVSINSESKVIEFDITNKKNKYKIISMNIQGTEKRSFGEIKD